MWILSTKTYQRLREFCQENALVIANILFQEHKRRLYTWKSPDGQDWNQINYIPCSQRWRRSIQSAQTRLGADCGSDEDLLSEKFRLTLKKIGKTIQVWPESNSLQLYSENDKYIEGIRSERQCAWRMMDWGLWHCTGGRDQDHPQEKEMQKGKIIVWGGLTNSWAKKRS